jgi:PASTA domain
MREQEQRLAEYLKRAVPEPPVWLSPEEITVQHPERSRKSWAMPVLAAAAVVAIGVTIGAVATHHSVTRPPAASSVADQGSTGSTSTGSTSTGSTSTGSAQPTPSCQAHGAGVTVPSVVGMNFSQATSTLEAAGFAVTVRPQTPGGQSAPAGTVIMQSAASGAQLARGTVIELTVSAPTTNWRHYIASAVAPNCPAMPSTVPSGVTVPSGSTVAVPNVIGMTQLQAEQILQAAGFRVNLRSETPRGQSGPAGEVWSQTVPAGAKAPRGTTITLDVVPTP